MTTIDDNDEALASRLRDLLDLEEGWDGGQAQPVSQQSALNALHFFVVNQHLLVSMPSGVVPVARRDQPSGIQIEWHLNGASIELEFDPDGTTELAIFTKNQKYATLGDIIRTIQSLT